MAFSSRVNPLASGFSLPPPPPPPAQSFPKDPTTYQVISNKHRVHYLYLNDTAALEGYELMNRDITFDSLKFEAKNGKIRISVNNNPDRYSFELKEDTLFIYHNLSLPNRSQPQFTELLFPFSEEVSIIRLVEVYPRLDIMDNARTAIPSRSFV